MLWKRPWLTPKPTTGAPLQDESVSTEKQKLAKTEDHPTLQADQLAISDAKRTLRKQQYDQVIALRQQGVFAADIAKHVGLGKRTVHRWLAHGSFPERKKRATQPTKIDPYRPYIHRRWQEGCQNLAQIYREIQALGYKGGRHAIYSQCQELRQTQARVQPPDSLLHSLKQTSRRYSPRQGCLSFHQIPRQAA